MSGGYHFALPAVNLEIALSASLTALESSVAVIESRLDAAELPKEKHGRCIPDSIDVLHRAR